MSGFEESPPSLPHYQGHRQRLRARFSKQGDAGLQDYELLELLLFRSLPRQDTKPIAKALLEKFGSLTEILAASERRLQEVKGVGQSVAIDLKLTHAVARQIAREEIEEKPLLSSWKQVIEYCRLSMGFSEVEQFRILFLNNKNYLIADEIQQTGTVNHTPVYPREVMRRALELSATALILVHNHPSGDPTPSRSDISMTEKLIEIAKGVDIEVHDHIIVTRDQHVSFRGIGLI